MNFLYVPVPEDTPSAIASPYSTGTLYADGTAVRGPSFGAGTTVGSDGYHQAVLWGVTGSVAKTVPSALEVTERPAPLPAAELAERARRATAYAERYLAATSDESMHPLPEDSIMEHRFHEDPAPLTLYGAIRAEALRIATERAMTPTPGAPHIGLPYSPLFGPGTTAPVTVGSILMTNAYSPRCGLYARVLEMGEDEKGAWALLQPRGLSRSYRHSAFDLLRWYVRVK